MARALLHQMLRQRWSRVALATLTFVATMPVYGALNDHLKPRFDLSVGLDAAVPLLPWSVVLYYTYFLIVPLSAARLPSAELPHFLLGLVAIFSACCVGFIALPAHYPRPEALPLHSVFGRALAWTYSMDRPGNNLPSLHVAFSTFCALTLWRARRSWLWLAWAACISASTLTTKQHFVLDVVAGVGLSSAVALLLARLKAGAHAPQRGSGRDPT